MSGRQSLELGAVNVDTNDPRLCCCICYHAYNTITKCEDAEVPVQLPCGHVFGAMCISKWLSCKSTCPLCRYKLLESDSGCHDHDYEHDIWLGAYDSHHQTPGTPSAQNSTYSVMPGFIDSWDRAMAHELMLSSALISTSPVHSLEAHLGTYPGIQQHTGLTSCSGVKARRRSSRSKVSTPCHHDDIWITALSDEDVEQIAPEIEDIWTSCIEEDRDELELLQVSFSFELPPSEMQDCFNTDSIFDDLYADHLQWMEELCHEMKSNVYDAFCCFG